MTYKTKKRIIWSVVLTTLALLIAAILFFSTRTSQTNLHADRTNGLIGELSITSNPIFFQIRPGLTFKVDTGSDISTISHKDVAFLDSLGFSVKKSFYPVYGRNGVGEMELTAERYTVSLPLYSWDYQTDSNGKRIRTCNFNDSNILHDVDFQISESDISVLGIDFLEKFKMEYKAGKGTIAFYLEDPVDYEYFAPIHTSYSPNSILTLSRRYYLDVSVDEDVDEYFIDTTLRKVFVKRPKRELSESAKNNKPEIISSLRGVYRAIPENGWIKIGNREGESVVHYYDNDEENYAINPLYISKFDVLLDFPNKQIKFRPL